MRKTRKYRISPRGRIILGMAIGIVLGLAIAFVAQQFLLKPCTANSNQCCFQTKFGDTKEVTDLQNQENVVADAVQQNINSNKKLVFIGVMTAQKYLDTRAVAAYRTWVKTIPGKVMFFSSAGSKSKYDIPVVALPGVDDSYPPQKKSFMMLKYMHDNYIDQYEWFMRADDDVYIRGERLANFLHSINNTIPRFIGQAGLGTKDEFGQLSLDMNQNFCMGGPGMVFSPSTLRQVTPRVSYCLKNLYSTHEDVEIGRCVQKFAGVPCTWAFEMQHLFYQAYGEDKKAFTGSLKTQEIHRAITLHPLKQPACQYRLHNYLQGMKVSKLHSKLLQQYREQSRMNSLLHENYQEVIKYALSPSLMKHVPNKRNDVITWDFLMGRLLFQDSIFYPKSGAGGGLKLGLEDIVMQTMEMINKNARQRGRTIDFKEILYGYRRINPFYGADYILDMLLVYRKHKGKRMTVPVRRHAYLHQTFLEIEFWEDQETNVGTTVPSSLSSSASPNLLKLFQDQFSKLASFSGPLQSSLDQTDLSMQYSDKTIHFILPLAGRFQTFQRFINNFEEVCLKTNENVKLAVILFEIEEDDPRTEMEKIVSELQSTYPSHDIRIVHVDGAFSRGLALERGASLYNANALLYFVDVDIMFNHAALQHVRENTRQHKQVYFPIVYSQFDPDMVCQNVSCPKSPFVITPDTGYWRQFGFGIVSLHKSDLNEVGGFDTSIQGWGKEDVDLYQKFLSSNITIFRVADAGMVHIFHPIYCDPKLEVAQYRMCLGSKSASFAQTRVLAEIVYKLPRVLNKNTKIGLVEEMDKQTNS